MGVLIDTSVWVDHFKYSNQGLLSLIELDIALTHPMVAGEIACGTPPAQRAATLRYISLLQTCNLASLTEVMTFNEREKLYGQGCGLVDITLLASTLITPGAQLWTLDKRLAELAVRFGVAYTQVRH